MIGLLSNALDWDVTKKIAGSRLVATSAIFPFIGYLALLNVELIGFFQLYIDSAQSPGLPTQSRIEEIYFAMLWISAGAILFQLSCPKEIKGFVTRYDLIEKEIEVTGPIRLQNIQRDVVKCKDAWWASEELRNDISALENVELSEQTERDDGIFGYASGNPSRADYLSTVGNSAYELLGVFYDCKRQSRFLIRMLVLIFVSIGYVKLSIPSVKVFWQLVMT